MTLAERAAAYARTFPGRPPLQLVEEGGGPALYGVWVMGNDYRLRSTFYGAYPHGYLPRVMALFPEFVEPRFPGHVLHLFSGSLPPGNYERCDEVQDAELPVSVYELPNIVLNYRPRLILADPPYSAADAEKYGTAMVNRGRVFRALAQVTRIGGHLVWLDTTWPMHRKAEWRTVGRITLVRSTNHRARIVSILERIAA